MAASMKFCASSQSSASLLELTAEASVTFEPPVVGATELVVEELTEMTESPSLLLLEASLPSTIGVIAGSISFKLGCIMDE